MSLYDYHVSCELAAADHPFDALIMAAMRRADTHNSAALRAAFPRLWDELHQRYHAPGGVLPGETGRARADGVLLLTHHPDHRREADGPTERNDR